MQGSGAHKSRVRRTRSCLPARGAGVLVWCLLLTAAARLFAQTPPVVVDVRVEQEGRPVTDPELLSLISVRPGEPLSMVAVKDSSEHLYALDRYDDVAVVEEDVPGGIRLIYRLVP